MHFSSVTVSSALLLFLVLQSNCANLNEEFSWTRLSYKWSERQKRLSSDDEKIFFPSSSEVNDDSTLSPNIYYNYTTNIPMGANQWKDKIFITVPRRRLGVPSTLNFIWANTTKKRNPELMPYPDWETNTRGKNNVRFVSVYRVGVDVCDRLWFVDTGLIELPGNSNQVQPPALVIMDLKTDKIILRHEFSADVLRANSGLASVTIDTTQSSCSDAFAYIPDLSGYGLIVYSLRENRSWRITHNYFFLETTSGEFTIGGHSFQWNDGIFSIALSAPKRDGTRDAFFHSMAGTNLHKVSTRILKNENLATRSYHEGDFQIVGNRGMKSQASSSDLHKESGVLFLGMVNQNAVGCWNINTPLQDLSVVKRDDQKMIYPSDVKIVNENKVMVLTNSMPVFLYGELDYDQVNFRIWSEDAEKAVEGTKCHRRRRS